MQQLNMWYCYWCLHSVLPYRTHLCLWQCSVSNISLSSSLLSLGSKLGQWKQEERPTVWLKNTTANFRLIHTYAALPLFPSVCPKDTPQPKPTGKRGQRESRPAPILPCTCFTVLSGCKLGQTIINTRTCGKHFLFHFHIYPLSSIWKTWKRTSELMLTRKGSIRQIFAILGVWHYSLWIFMEKKLLCTLTFLLHACFTRGQQSAAMEWSALHSLDDCRDKQGGSLINMQLIVCRSLHLCRLSLHSCTDGCRRTTVAEIFTHRTTTAQPWPFHSYSHMTTDQRFV